ncbi:DNA topoisomerase 2, partial [Massospora cicadina]
MTDQDHDRLHIKGLLINFFYYVYSSLLAVDDFMQEFITPIFKDIPKNQQNKMMQFFTIPKYVMCWDNPENNASSYNVKYYKGLTTSDQREGIKYFSNLNCDIIGFEPMKDDECQLIDLTFSKKEADAHNKWLSQFHPGAYIDHSGDSITYTDFINKLIHFFADDNICSIPSVVDALKPGQRKVVYGYFLHPEAEVKVGKLTGSIIEKVAYHHGDQNLASTIIGLSHKFMWANNVNLLASLEQFGSHTQSVDVVSNLQLLMQGESPILMMPWYLGFTSNIEPSVNNCYTVRSCITKLDESYDAMMEDWHLNSSIIKDYEKRHSNLGVRYIVQVPEASLAKLEKEDLYAIINLINSISISNLVCFGKSSCIIGYASAEEILTKFYNIHLKLYHKCREDLVSKLIQDYAKISLQAHFTLAIINEEIKMRNVTHADLIKQLIDMEFDFINTMDNDGPSIVLWEDMVEENQLTFAQSLTECTRRSNKKGRRVASKSKLNKESKETKPKGLDRSNSASKPAAMKLESPSHAKAKLGIPPSAKPFSRSNITSMPKSKPYQDDSDDSDDQFKDRLSQKAGKKLPSDVEPTSKSVAKALALDKPKSKPKAAQSIRTLKSLIKRRT